MKQTRRTSMLESIANTIVGWIVALVGQILIFPLFGINIPLSSSAEIGLLFVGISTLRSYALRRAFEHLRVKRILP